MGWLRNVIIISVIAYAAKVLYPFLVHLGVGVHFNNVRPGKCRVVSGIECGSEKIAVSEGGLAFITNGLREMTRCNRDYLRGNLYTFDFNNPNNNVTKLKIISSDGFDADGFAPHGMD